MSIKFVESIPSDGRSRRWGAIRDELRANPGRWAEIERFPGRTSLRASSARTVLITGHPDIEATTRSVGDETVLYALAVAR